MNATADHVVARDRALAAPRGQRVRNRHPDGGATGVGISPITLARASGRMLGSGTGIASSNTRVYGCDGCS